RGARALVPFLRRVRAERYQVALDLGRGVKSALIAWASGAGERIGFARADAREGSWLLATRRLPPQGTGRPKLAQFLAFAVALGRLRATAGGVRDLVGRTTLRQLLAILARTRLAFGPDSGALHLAAALGTPAVSLWGATSALRSTPFGCERLTVVGRAPCAP